MAEPQQETEALGHECQIQGVGQTTEHSRKILLIFTTVCFFPYFHFVHSALAACPDLLPCKEQRLPLVNQALLQVAHKEHGASDVSSLPCSHQLSVTALFWISFSH